MLQAPSPKQVAAMIDTANTSTGFCRKLSVPLIAVDIPHHTHPTTEPSQLSHLEASQPVT